MATGGILMYLRYSPPPLNRPPPNFVQLNYEFHGTTVKNRRSGDPKLLINLNNNLIKIIFNVYPYLFRITVRIITGANLPGAVYKILV